MRKSHSSIGLLVAFGWGLGYAAGCGPGALAQDVPKVDQPPVAPTAAPAGSHESSPKVAAPEVNAATVYSEALGQSKPLAPKPVAFEADKVKVSAELCTVSDGRFVGPNPTELYSAIRVAGDRVAVLFGAPTQIKIYKVEAGAGCALTLDTSAGDAGTIKLNHESVEKLSADSQGRLYGTSTGTGTLRFKKDFAIDYKCSADPGGHFVPHGAGNWGFAYSPTGPLANVDFGAADCRSESAFLDAQNHVGPFSSIDTLAFSGELALIGGPLGEGGKKVVLAFTKAGKEKFRFGTAPVAPRDGFTSVTALSLCKGGICVLDASARLVSVWSTDGKKHVVDVPLGKLLDVHDGLFTDFTAGKVGTFIAVSQERDVKKVHEGLIYRLSGL